MTAPTQSPPPSSGVPILDELANAVGGRIDSVAALPDGSGAATMSMPLPADHWLTRDHHNAPPMRLRMAPGENRKAWAELIREAGRYAIRAATMNGKEQDFDPDAMLQNLCVGFLGYWTDVGTSDSCGDPYDNPDPIPPLFTQPAPTLDAAPPAPAAPDDWDLAMREFEDGTGPLAPAPAAPAACHCEACEPHSMVAPRMILCAICGNKRCPHATDHRNACTNSNEPGQKGSSYEACPKRGEPWPAAPAPDAHMADVLQRHAEGAESANYPAGLREDMRRVVAHVYAQAREIAAANARVEVAEAATRAAVSKAQWQATTNAELNKAQADAAEARADADDMRTEAATARYLCAVAVQELKNIRDTDPSKWDAEVREQFQQWAQSRARFALAAIDAARSAARKGDGNG